MSRKRPCVVSVADHTGWAHLVCVAARGNVPAVIARRRVALIDHGLPTMPYEHDTSAMGRTRPTRSSRGTAIDRRPDIGGTAASRDRAGARAYGRRPRDSGAPVRRPSRNSRRCEGVASSALRRGWDAVSAGHLPRGAAARARRTPVPPWRGSGTGRAAPRRDPCRNRGVRQSRPAGRPARRGRRSTGGRTPPASRRWRRTRAASQDSAAVTRAASRTPSPRSAPKETSAGAVMIGSR